MASSHLSAPANNQHWCHEDEPAPQVVLWRYLLFLARSYCKLFDYNSIFWQSEPASYLCLLSNHETFYTFSSPLHHHITIRLVRLCLRKFLSKKSFRHTDWRAEHSIYQYPIISPASNKPLVRSRFKNWNFQLHFAHLPYSTLASPRLIRSTGLVG